MITIRGVSLLGIGVYRPSLWTTKSAILGRGNRAKPKTSDVRWIRNRDEDVATMTFEAARPLLEKFGYGSIRTVYLAAEQSSTWGRLRAPVVSGAVGISGDAHCSDVVGTSRAGSSAMVASVNAAAASGGQALCLAGHDMYALAGSPRQISDSHGGVALLFGSGDGLADVVGHRSSSSDNPHAYVRIGDRQEHRWDNRWYRDTVLGRQLPEVINGLIDEAVIDRHQVSALCLPVVDARQNALVARASGLDSLAPVAPAAGLHGAAQPLMALADTIDAVTPDQYVIVAGVGQGVDAVLLRRASTNLPVHQVRNNEVHECSYAEYLRLADLVATERTLRADTDRRQILPAMSRNAALTSTMTGGRCAKCGTEQFPRAEICVAPKCHFVGAQEKIELSRRRGRLRTFTRDYQAATTAAYNAIGMVDFDGGSRLLMDVADVFDETAAQVGDPVLPTLRIKETDERRGLARYFWKAALTDGTKIDA
jgi:uncharacterized OB-fold protein/3-oxoacyl-[acyl-carrier-protein] synthase III